MRITEICLIITTYLLAYLQLIGVNSSLSNISCSVLDSIMYFIFISSGLLFVVSQVKTMITNPGKILEENQMDFIRFEMKTRLVSIARGLHVTTMNNKFFYSDVDDTINKTLEEEYNSDDSDLTVDSTKYVDHSQSFSTEELAKEAEKENLIGFNIKRKCSKCFVRRIPYSIHCARCKG